MFSQASGHNVVLHVAAGKCSLLVGVYEISTRFIQICLGILQVYVFQS